MDVTVKWAEVRETRAVFAVPDGTPDADIGPLAARHAEAMAAGQVVRGTVKWETADGRRFGGSLA